jgi:hypothetical protein
VRRATLRKKAQAGGFGPDDFGHVADHRAHRDDQSSEDRDRGVPDEWVAVGLSPFGVRVSVQGHLEAERPFVVRRVPIVMVVCRNVKRGRPSDGPGRRQRHHCSDCDGSLQGTLHAGQYP